VHTLALPGAFKCKQKLITLFAFTNYNGNDDVYALVLVYYRVVLFFIRQQRFCCACAASFFSMGISSIWKYL